MELKDSAEYCSNCGFVIKDINTVKENQTNQRNDSSTNSNLGLIIGGWICTAVSTLFFPILFGAAAVICGYLLSKKNKEHGVVMMIAGVACAIFGFVLGAATY
jgi:hypothetical protein